MPKLILLFAGFVSLTLSCTKQQSDKYAGNEYVGSGSCKECHEKFYEL